MSQPKQDEAKGVEPPSTDDILEGQQIEKAPSGPPGPPKWMQDIPDGGLEAWLVILGNWCTNFVTFGWINST